MSATKQVKQYSGPPVHTPLQPENWPDPILDTDDNIQGDCIDKVNAGARLFFALYHHPQAKELFSSPYMTRGLLQAYMAASKAWGM